MNLSHSTEFSSGREGKEKEKKIIGREKNKRKKKIKSGRNTKKRKKN